MKLSSLLKLTALVASLGADAAATVKIDVDSVEIDQAVKAEHIAALKEHNINLKDVEVKLFKYTPDSGLTEREFLNKIPISCHAACSWSTICTADGWFLDLGASGTKLWPTGSACMIWQDFQGNFPAWEGEQLSNGMRAIVDQTAKDGWGKTTRRGKWRARWADTWTTAFANRTDGIKFALLFEESQFLAEDEKDPNWHELAGAQTVRWARNRDAAVMYHRGY